MELCLSRWLPILGFKVKGLTATVAMWWHKHEHPHEQKPWITCSIGMIHWQINSRLSSPPSESHPLCPVVPTQTRHTHTHTKLFVDRACAAAIEFPVIDILIQMSSLRGAWGLIVVHSWLAFAHNSCPINKGSLVKGRKEECTHLSTCVNLRGIYQRPALNNTPVQNGRRSREWEPFWRQNGNSTRSLTCERDFWELTNPPEVHDLFT